ncbi:MAG: hypothetical protein ABSB42_17820 [Tepidisphaeraceae bacterium]
MLVQPPNRRKAFNNNQVVNRVLDAMEVVQQFAFVEFPPFLITLTRAGKQIFGFLIAHLPIIHQPAGEADE